MPKDQPELNKMDGPGVAPVEIKALDEAFSELLGHRKRRMAAQEKEIAASSVLVSLFHKHGLKCYNYDEKKYTIKQVEKVTLARKDEELE